MRISVILHGNLRTFFMPLRENPHLRVCDLIRSNIVEHNMADVFLVTDTTDFYYEGTQYFNDKNEVVDMYESMPNVKDTFENVDDFVSKSSMFYSSIGFMPEHEAMRLLSTEIDKFFKGAVKSIEVRNVVDVRVDPKFVLLSQHALAGCSPARIVNQYRKIKTAYNLMQQYESKNFCYDVVFRGRFDNAADQKRPLKICSYNFQAYDIFVPGIAPPFIYDWSAFGNRRAMGLVLCLYDQLGSTISDRIFRCECQKCHTVSCGQKSECKCGGEMKYSEYTLSSEYHLYKMLMDNKMKASPSCYPMSPYRYR